MLEFEPGSVINSSYRVLSTLGQGSFGRTLLAEEVAGGRKVAIKVLHTHRAEDWKIFQLFEREAQVLSSLRHHGVPEVYQVLRVGEGGGGNLALVMEYIEGESIATVISAQRHIDPADVSHWFLELLGVLDYLHGRVPPILHRDIKPANIIVRPNGFPALVDFGSVRSVLAPEGDSGSTIVGTYGYMPYEQHMGQATPASDLYALAATFLHLLTGRAPPEFIGPDGRIAVPASVPGGERWRAVLTRMLHPSPADRYQSARDVRQALLTTQDTVRASASTASITTGRRLSAGAVSLPPAPRDITDDVAKRFSMIAPSSWNFLSSGERPDGQVRISDLVMVAMLTSITLGILPLILLTRAAARRRKLRTFFRAGTPGLAVITAIQEESIEFRMRMTRVRYEFVADEESRRDVDVVQAWIADKWRPGDEIEILYLPERHFDSVIVSIR